MNFQDNPAVSRRKPPRFLLPQPAHGGCGPAVRLAPSACSPLFWNGDLNTLSGIESARYLRHQPGYNTVESTENDIGFLHCGVRSLDQILVQHPVPVGSDQVKLTKASVVICPEQNRALVAVGAAAICTTNQPSPLIAIFWAVRSESMPR